MTQETIAAVITAPGIGAMGAIRLSGPNAYDAVAKVFRGKHGTDIHQVGEYSLHYGGVYIDGAFLDQALLLIMKGPHSYTGEDVAELQCHGGPVVIGLVLSALTGIVDHPVREALPGEFSLRAFQHGKMDLNQAEAVMELVMASNTEAAFLAASQVEGALSRRIGHLAEGILLLLAQIEVEIDFPDEELSELDGEEARREAASQLVEEANQLLASAQRGRLYKEGLRLVFYGRPNAGKSSLLNGLLQEPRAIVTPEPGTTRDIVEERIILKGIPLLLTDTAGIRESVSQAEQAGVERARDTAGKADLVLYVVDADEGMTPEDERLIRELDKDKCLIILNKVDLLPASAMDDAAYGIPTHLQEWSYCHLCALDAESMDILADRIRLILLEKAEFSSDQGIVLNRRQTQALFSARQALMRAEAALESGIPEDIASIDLREAWAYLGELSGETLQPVLVETIFSTFCLGK